MPIVPVTGRLNPEDLELKVSLCCKNESCNYDCVHPSSNDSEAGGLPELSQEFKAGISNTARPSIGK